MNKREREKAEREKLKQMMNNNPKLLAFLESAVDKSNNQDLKALIEPVLVDTFEKIRMQGIQIGWYSHATRCVAKIKDCKTVDEAIEKLEKEVNEVAEKLGISSDYFEEGT